MHRQLLARYDAERQGVKLRPVRSFGGDSYREVIPQGYDSHLVMFASRPPGMRLGDLHSRSEDPVAIRTIASMELWCNRLWEAIDQDKFRKVSPPEAEQLSMNLLGEVIESSLASDIDCGSHGYYGNLHNTGHNVIAKCHDPDGENSSMVQPMGDVIASIRDPVFWEWHKHIDQFGYLYEQKHGKNLNEYIRSHKAGNLKISAVRLFKNMGRDQVTGRCQWEGSPTTCLDTFMERKLSSFL